MLTLNHQYITDSEGKKVSVVLPIEEFKTILEKLEEWEDVRRYDEATKGTQEFVEAQQAFEEIERKRGENV